MYARLVRFRLRPGALDAAQSITDSIGSLIAAQSGCQSVTTFGDAENGEYGIFVLWDSEDDGNAAARVIRPKLEEHLAGHLQGPLDASLFKVLSFEEIRGDQR